MNFEFSSQMNRIKKIVKKGLYHIRVYDGLRYFQRNRVIILMYHRFSDSSEPFKIQKDVFEKQIVFLKKKYNFTSLSHYADLLTGKRNDLPPNPIILTIDDGYWDNYAYAYPVLKKYSIPATIFLTTDFITHGAWLWANKLEYILKNSMYKQFDFPLNDRMVHFDVSNFKNWHKTQLKIFNYCITIPNSKKDDLLDSLSEELNVDVPNKAVDDFKPLSWNQVREMSAECIEFGSHTLSHPILSRLSHEELTQELVDSKTEIESKIDRKVVSISYPNGKIEDISDTVLKYVEKAGYQCGVTTIVGCNRIREQNSLVLKRLSIIDAHPMILSAEISKLFP